MFSSILMFFWWSWWCSLARSFGFEVEVGLFSTNNLTQKWWEKKEIIYSAVDFSTCPNFHSIIEGELVVFYAFFMQKPVKLIFQAHERLVIDKLTLKCNRNGRNFIKIHVSSPKEIQKGKAKFSRIDYHRKEKANGNASGEFLIGIPRSAKNVTVFDYLGKVRFQKIGEETLKIKPRFPLVSGFAYEFTVAFNWEKIVEICDLTLYYECKKRIIEE